MVRVQYIDEFRPEFRYSEIDRSATLTWAEIGRAVFRLRPSDSLAMPNPTSTSAGRKLWDEIQNLVKDWEIWSPGPPYRSIRLPHQPISDMFDDRFAELHALDDKSLGYDPTIRANKCVEKGEFDDKFHATFDLIKAFSAIGRHRKSDSDVLKFCGVSLGTQPVKFSELAAVTGVPVVEFYKISAHLRALLALMRSRVISRNNVGYLLRVFNNPNAKSARALLELATYKLKNLLFDSPLRRRKIGRRPKS